MKKEGKLLSEAEKKRKAQQDLRMRQLLDAGVKVAGLEGTATEKTKDKASFDKKKKVPKKQEEDLEAAAERARLQALAAEEERRKVAEEAERAKAAAAELESAKDESDGVED